MYCRKEGKNAERQANKTVNLRTDSISQSLKKWGNFVHFREQYEPPTVYALSLYSPSVAILNAPESSF